MTQEPKRTFAQSRTLAFRLGRALTAIEKHWGYNDRIAHTGAEMGRVSTALDLVSATANASLSRETLDAFDRLIDEAAAGFRGWVADVLDPARQIEDDEIPY